MSGSSRPQIVASLLVQGVDAAHEGARRAVVEGADLVEYRLDLMSDADQVQALVRGSPAPCVIACRIAEDGGYWAGTPADRRALLLAAARAGASWVDLEHWETLCLPAELPVRVVRSYHRLMEAPRELPSIVERMARSGPDLLKVTVRGYDAAEIDLVVELYAQRQGQANPPLVAFLAGEAVNSSRLLALLAGAPWIYCAARQGAATAPGQLGVSEACQLLRVHERGRQSRFWGLCGKPVAHSLGVDLHNRLHRFFDGETPLYLGFETEKPERLFKALRAFGPRFAGLSVTAPHKRAMLGLADQLSTEAEACGAINTLVASEDAVHGHNTDVYGVRHALRRYLGHGETLEGRRALVIGGGGSARAAAMALVKEGCSVRLAVRSRQIRDFAERFALEMLPLDAELLRREPADVLVHATPVGQAGGEGEGQSLLDPATISDRALVLDLVYRPAWTPLLEAAAAAGAVPICGLWMFLYQAAEQIRLVLGQVAPSVDELAPLLGPAARELRQADQRARAALELSAELLGDAQRGDEAEEAADAEEAEEGGAERSS